MLPLPKRDKSRNLQDRERRPSVLTVSVNRRYRLGLDMRSPPSRAGPDKIEMRS